MDLFEDESFFENAPEIAVRHQGLQDQLKTDIAQYLEKKPSKTDINRLRAILNAAFPEKSQEHWIADYLTERIHGKAAKRMKKHAPIPQQHALRALVLNYEIYKDALERAKRERFDSANPRDHELKKILDQLLAPELSKRNNKKESDFFAINISKTAPNKRGWDWLEKKQDKLVKVLEWMTPVMEMSSAIFAMERLKAEHKEYQSQKEKHMQVQRKQELQKEEDERARREHEKINTFLNEIRKKISELIVSEGEIVDGSESRKVKEMMLAICGTPEQVSEHFSTFFNPSVLLQFSDSKAWFESALNDKDLLEKSFAAPVKRDTESLNQEQLDQIWNADLELLERKKEVLMVQKKWNKLEDETFQRPQLEGSSDNLSETGRAALKKIATGNAYESIIGVVLAHRLKRSESFSLIRVDENIDGRGIDFFLEYPHRGDGGEQFQDIMGIDITLDKIGNKNMDTYSKPIIIERSAAERSLDPSTIREYFYEGDTRQRLIFQRAVLKMRGGKVKHLIRMVYQELLNEEKITSRKIKEVYDQYASSISTVHGSPETLKELITKLFTVAMQSTSDETDQKVFLQMISENSSPLKKTA